MDAFVPRAHSGSVLGVGLADGDAPGVALGPEVAVGVGVTVAVGLARTAPEPVFACSRISGSSFCSFSKRTFACS